MPGNALFNFRIIENSGDTAEDTADLFTCGKPVLQIVQSKTDAAGSFFGAHIESIGAAPVIEGIDGTGLVKQNTLCFVTAGVECNKILHNAPP